MKFKLNRNRTKKLVGFDGIALDVFKELNLEESFITGNIKAVWGDIAGNIIASHSMPDRIYKGTLFIAADHSIFANDISMMKNAIIIALNERFPFSGIKNIKVEIKKLRWNN